MVRNIAGYKFAALDNLRERRAQLLLLCHGLKGTILLSPEGINLFVAGSPEKMPAVQQPALGLDVRHNLER